MDYKKAIEALIKITANQQKIIEKLAQAPAANLQDPNVKYLQQAFQVAALNSGIAQISTPTVVLNAGSTVGNVKVDATYTITVAGIPSAMRQKVLDTFKRQVKTQHPALDGKTSVVFA